MKLVRGKRLVKETLSLIVVLSISGIGAAVAHAQQGKQEGVNSAPSAVNKDIQKQPRFLCWIRGEPHRMTRQYCAYNEGIVDDALPQIHCRIADEKLIETRQHCAYDEGIVEEDQDSR